MSGFNASPAQRAKVRHERCIVCRREPCDPAHLTARGSAAHGCDAAECVVPLCRSCHNAFDEGRLDILPSLLALKMVREVQHAVGHFDGNLLGLLHRLTGERFVPEDDRRVA